MLQLIYTSIEAFPMRIVDIAKILSQSRRHNEKTQISGYLIYHKGSFMQIIEGADEDIKSLYKRIEKDDRHRNIKLIYCVSISERAFDGWSMGYVDSDLVDSSAEISKDTIVEYFQKKVWKNNRIDSGIINRIVEVIKRFQNGSLGDYVI